MGIAPKKRQSPLLLLLSLLAVSPLLAKKTQPVLDWKPGTLWASPDPCTETDFSVVTKQTFLIVGDNLLFHLSRTSLIGHKPNVTERGEIKYAMADGDFYLQDDDGRVFKLSVVKKELNPDELERFKNGKQACRP